MRLNFEEVRKLLPHRYPFILVDKVIECVPNERIVGIKNISGNEPYFQGHFPDGAVMPGVLITEAMAQTALLLFRISTNDTESGRQYLLSSIKVNFLQPVYPGDQMVIEVTPLKILSNAGMVKAVCLVGDQIVAKGDITFAVNNSGEVSL